jgi:hypothetical protein
MRSHRPNGWPIRPVWGLRVMPNSKTTDFRNTKPLQGILILVVLFVGGILVQRVIAEFHRAANEAYRRSVIMQLGFAIRMYAQDHDDRLPLAGHWARAIQPYCRGYPSLGGCEGIPSASVSTCEYAFNQPFSGQLTAKIDPTIGVVWENPVSVAAKGRSFYWACLDGEDQHEWPVGGPLPPRVR